MYEPGLRVPSFKALTNVWLVSRAGAKSLMERCRLGSHHSQHTVAVTANNGKQSHASHHTQDTERMPAGQTAAGTGEAWSIYKCKNILFKFSAGSQESPPQEVQLERAHMEHLHLARGGGAGQL